MSEIEASDLSARAKNALANEGIKTLAEVRALGPMGLKMPNVGEITIAEIGLVLFNEDWSRAATRSPPTGEPRAKNPALAEFSNQQLRDELAARGAEYRQTYSGMLKHAIPILISGRTAGLDVDGIIARIKAESWFPEKSPYGTTGKNWERATVKTALRSLGLAFRRRTADISKQRHAEVLALREGGLSFREIGDRLGVSRSRAAQMAERAARERARLSTRAALISERGDEE